jgi:deoxyhypusine synthase
MDMGSHPRLPTADKTETPLSIDIVSDIRRLNDLSIKSKKAGMIILGGGVCKHQIANSMLFVRSSCSLSDSALFLVRAAEEIWCCCQLLFPPS